MRGSCLICIFRLQINTFYEKFFYQPANYVSSHTGVHACTQGRSVYFLNHIASLGSSAQVSQTVTCIYVSTNSYFQPHQHHTTINTNYVSDQDLPTTINHDLDQHQIGCDHNHHKINHDQHEETNIPKNATSQPKEPLQHISCLCLKEPRTEFHEHREFQDQTGFESSPENIDHFWQLSESFKIIELIGSWVNVQCTY